jgi:hypothetical protein
VPGSEWPLECYGTFARSLGLAQGRAARLRPEHPWLSRSFLRSYSGSKAVDWSLPDDDAAWAPPLVRECFPPGLRPQMGRLHKERETFLPAEQLPELDELVFRSYRRGLREAGWSGEDRHVRLAMCASAIKYEWLVPLMLARAGDERQLDYGREREISAEQRYAERGAALAFLAGWAEEARWLSGASPR